MKSRICRNRTPRTESHDDCARGLLDLRPWEARFLGQLDHLERTAAPGLDDAAAIEDARDEGVPRQGLVRLEEGRGRQIEMQWTGRGHLQAVVVQRDPDRPPAHRVIAVADGIGQRLPDRQGRIQRLVDTLQALWNNPSRDRYVLNQETLRLQEEVDRMAPELPVVEELGLVLSLEARHPQQALGILGQEPLTLPEQYHRRAQERSPGPKPQAPQNGIGLPRAWVLDATGADPLFQGPQDLLLVQVRYGPGRSSASPNAIDLSPSIARQTLSTNVLARSKASPGFSSTACLRASTCSSICARPCATASRALCMTASSTRMLAGIVLGAIEVHEREVLPDGLHVLRHRVQDGLLEFPGELEASRPQDVHVPSNR